MSLIKNHFHTIFRLKLLAESQLSRFIIDKQYIHTLTLLSKTTSCNFHYRHLITNFIFDNKES